MPAPDRLPLRDVIETFVRGCHLGILRRPVGDDWLERFSDELQRRAATQPLDEVAADFARILAESPEAKERWGGPALARSVEDLVAPAMAGRPAPLHCIPAGCMPAAAGLVRRAGLRRWAGPFDWMTIPPAAVRDCIADDFIALLNPAAYSRIPATARPEGQPGWLCLHDRLTERHGETVFHHFDPTTSDGYAKLERAAMRMRDALRALHGKMLFQLVVEDADTAALFAETAEVVGRVGRGCALAVVALLPGAPEGPFPEMELAQSLGPHRLLRARALTPPAGIAFADPLDEVVLLRGALATVTRQEEEALA